MPTPQLTSADLSVGKREARIWIKGCGPDMGDLLSTHETVALERAFAYVFMRGRLGLPTSEELKCNSKKSE